LHKRALPLAVVLHTIKVKRLDAASLKKKNEKNAYIHHKHNSLCESGGPFGNNKLVISKATEDIVDISMNMHYL